MIDFSLLGGKNILVSHVNEDSELKEMMHKLIEDGSSFNLFYKKIEGSIVCSEEQKAELRKHYNSFFYMLEDECNIHPETRRKLKSLKDIMDEVEKVQEAKNKLLAMKIHSGHSKENDTVITTLKTSNASGLDTLLDEDDKKLVFDSLIGKYDKRAKECITKFYQIVGDLLK